MLAGPVAFADIAAHRGLPPEFVKSGEIKPMARQ
jgi:hypothetical protein